MKNDAKLELSYDKMKELGYNPMDKRLNEKNLDKLNRYISERIIRFREAMFVTTVLTGQIVLRMCLINPRTTLDDVKETLKLCTKFAKEKYTN